jgi:serine protease inhibitor
MMKKVQKLMLVTVAVFTFIFLGSVSAVTPDSGSSFQAETAPSLSPAPAVNPTALVDANSQFAFAIFKQINRTEADKNVFISPLSISTALAMLYQGADNDTKDEIAQTLNYSEIEITKLNSDYRSLLNHLKNGDSFVELNIGNSVWYDDGFHVKPDFLKTNQEAFDAEIKGLDFTKADAADTINLWISNVTQGMIDKMVDPPLTGVMYLINAIYFKGAWTNPFDPNLTQKSTFKTESGKTNPVDMMYSNTAADFGKGTDYSAIRLPYGKQQISMYCVLPAEGLAIDNFISGLTVDKFNEIKRSLSARSFFDVKLPKFKMAYGAKSLKTVLNRLGMNKAFNFGQADFSGISNEPLWVDDVLHKAVIDVNEEGTTAAATTIIIMPTATMDRFLANRPFLFFIVDDATGSILFMGKAADLAEY